MADDGVVTVYSGSAITEAKKNPFFNKTRMAQMLEGGEIVEVTSVDQAKIAESADAGCIVVSEPNTSGISISNFLQMNFN